MEVNMEESFEIELPARGPPYNDVSICLIFDKFFQIFSATIHFNKSLYDTRAVPQREMHLS